jgi:hypothetical protein
MKTTSRRKLTVDADTTVTAMVRGLAYQKNVLEFQELEPITYGIISSMKTLTLEGAIPMLIATVGEAAGGTTAEVPPGMNNLIQLIQKRHA